MASTSRLVQISEYALLEYEYNAVTHSTADYGLVRITDSTDGTYQIVNATDATDPMGNVLDRSAMHLSANRWAHLDQDRGVPYNDAADHLTVEALTDLTVTSYPVVYDRVRIHLLSGYNLEDIAGFVVEVLYPDNSGKKLTAASHVFMKGDTWLEFNPNAIPISEKHYDRYIEFLIPSMDWLNTEFYANPDNPSGELAYYFSTTNEGFDEDGLIHINFYDVLKTKVDNGQLFLYTDNPTAASITSEDRYTKLSAVVKESEDGDYFEYYPSWEGGFIADYIADLNSIGGDYAVIHTVRVTSQVGFSEIEEQSFTTFQETGFDTPNTFRPIVKNADQAYAFSIDYTMRLYDRLGQIQIIRRASLTSYEPRKYGKNMERIQLATDLQPYRVVNKVYEGSKFAMPGITSVSKVETVYVPTFYQMNNIAASSQTIIIDSNAEVTSEKFLDSGYIFGQGDAIALLSPFDNYLKFRLYRAMGRTAVPEPMDLSYSMDVQLVFIDDAGQKRRFPRIKTQKDIRPEAGDLLFRIPATESRKILGFLNTNFYITTQAEVVNDTSPIDEVTLYTGTFRPYDQIDEVIDEINKLKEDRLLARARDLRDREAKLNALQEALANHQKQLDAQEAQQEARAESQDLERKRLSLQEITLDEKGKLLSEQSAILRDREVEFRSLIKDSQEKENLAISQFQQLLAALQSKLDSLRGQAPNLGADGEGQIELDANGNGIADSQEQDDRPPVGRDPYGPPIPGRGNQDMNTRTDVIIDQSGIGLYTPGTGDRTDGGMSAGDIQLNPNLFGESRFLRNPSLDLSRYINIVEIPGKGGSDLGIGVRFSDTPDKDKAKPVDTKALDRIKLLLANTQNATKEAKNTNTWKNPTHRQ